MLKRKANLWTQENEDPCTSQEEVTQRKIYRARRPARPAPSENHKFKITTNLLSQEQEARLLTRPTHSRTRSFNPFISLNFSSYSLIEPLKDLMRNDRPDLEVFLSSRREAEKSVKFTSECLLIQDSELKGVAEIIEEGDKPYLSIKTPGQQTEARIWKNSYCREVQHSDRTLINIVLDPQLSVSIALPDISKHLFLRSFSEVKSKSFF